LHRYQGNNHTTFTYSALTALIIRPRRIRFGVEKGCSFLSFLEEPKTQFSATSAMGVLSNIPVVPELVVMALNKHLSEKMVYPGETVT
jgi:hypothetical protein